MRKGQAVVSLVGVPRELTNDALSEIIEMARSRAALVAEMKRALEAGDDQHALRVARTVCGLMEQPMKQ